MKDDARVVAPDDDDEMVGRGPFFNQRDDRPASVNLGVDAVRRSLDRDRIPAPRSKIVDESGRPDSAGAAVDKK